jgi:hypothetical protein
MTDLTTGQLLELLESTESVAIILADEGFWHRVVSLNDDEQKEALGERLFEALPPDEGTNDRLLAVRARRAAMLAEMIKLSAEQLADAIHDFVLMRKVR